MYLQLLLLWVLTELRNCGPSSAKIFDHARVMAARRVRCRLYLQLTSWKRMCFLVFSQRADLLEKLQLSRQQTHTDFCRGWQAKKERATKSTSFKCYYRGKPRIKQINLVQHFAVSVKSRVSSIWSVQTCQARPRCHSRCQLTPSSGHPKWTHL